MPLEGSFGGASGEMAALIVLSEGGQLMVHDLHTLQPLPLSLPFQELPPVTASAFAPGQLPLGEVRFLLTHGIPFYFRYPGPPECCCMLPSDLMTVSAFASGKPPPVCTAFQLLVCKKYSPPRVWVVESRHDYITMCIERRQVQHSCPWRTLTSLLTGFETREKEPIYA